MLSVDQITIGYHGKAVLKQVSLEVSAGGMVALIGPNGAGKTTLLNAISCVISNGRGISFAGQSLERLQPYKVSRLGLLHVPEGRQILGPLTVRENLELGRLATGGRGGKDELTRVFDLFPILASRQHQEAGRLSGGEQQMLAIGRALMGRPRMLLLDEPSLGLAPLMINQVFAALTQLNREGLPMLLVEQNARRALEVTHYAYVIEQGRIAIHGPSNVLLEDPQIAAHYFGYRTT